MLVAEKKPLMAVYEENFQALLQLMPDMNVDAAILSAPGMLPDLHMKILERSKYTVTLVFLHVLDDEQIVPDMYLKIRVYFDARLAEVVTYQNKTGFARIYTYPNNRLRYPTEKRRVNQFLTEWLAYCNFKGYCPAYCEAV